MIKTMNVAKETGQDYPVLIYDLAVALKVYAIQLLEAPAFDIVTSCSYFWEISTLSWLSTVPLEPW